MPPAHRTAGLGRWAWLAPRRGRRLGRGLALGLIAVLAVAAVAGANLLGLPGIRIVPAPPPTSTPIATTPGSAPAASPSPSTPTRSPSPSPSPIPVATIASPLGSNLGLGDPVSIAGLARAVDFPVAVPPRARVGDPATAWIRDGRLTLVWATTPTLPATAEPGVGLVLGQFRGGVDQRYFEKVLDQGTTIETVAIGDLSGYWIGGAPHEIVYVDARGEPLFDSRRSVADTLLWTRGDVTYRLESGLGRAATIELARSIP